MFVCVCVSVCAYMSVCVCIYAYFCVCVSGRLWAGLFRWELLGISALIIAWV